MIRAGKGAHELQIALFPNGRKMQTGEEVLSGYETPVGSAVVPSAHPQSLSSLMGLR